MIFLTIDDSEDIRELISYAVREEFPDGNILEAASGNEGSQLLRRFHDRIQGIICDYHMPDGNGLMVFRTWLESFTHLPFILFSSDTEMAEKTFLKGFENRPTNLYFLDKQEGVDGLGRLVQEVSEKSLFQLPINRIKPNDGLSLSLYLKINGMKYVKYSHQDNSSDGLKALLEKKLEYVFVPYKELAQRGYRWPFSSVGTPSELSLKESFECFKELHQRALAETIGNEELLKSGFHWLETVIETQGKNVDLGALIDGVSSKRDYILNHSFLTLLISFMALKEMGSNTEVCRSILFYGIMFHDLLRTDDEAFEKEVLLKSAQESYKGKQFYLSRITPLLNGMKVDTDAHKVLEGLIFGLDDSQIMEKFNHKLVRVALLSHKISNDLYRENFLRTPLTPREKGVQGALLKAFQSITRAGSSQIF